MAGFLQRNRELIATIETRVDEVRAAAAAHTDPSVTASWLPHFEQIWRAVRDEQGWGPEAPPTRAERLVRRARTLGARALPRHVVPPPPAGARPHFASPVFDEAVELPPPGERTAYETAYGFSLVASGVDLWQPLATGHYSAELVETWLMLELAGHVDTFVDVGANVGFFALLMATDGVAAVACEPSSANLAALRRAVELNGLEERLQVMPVAVGAQPGTVTLQLCAYGSGGHSVVPVPGLALLDETEEVALTTLDALRADAAVGDRVLLKLDVEGLEEAVLAGGAEWLSSPAAPIVIVEAWPASVAHPEDNHEVVVGHLRRHGYRCFAIDDGDLAGGVLTPITEARFAPAPAANYLALPAWATDLEPRLRAPIDPRVFTATARLEAMDGYLERTVAGLRAAAGTPAR